MSFIQRVLCWRFHCIKFCFPEGIQVIASLPNSSELLYRLKLERIMCVVSVCFNTLSQCNCSVCSFVMSAWQRTQTMMVLAVIT